MHPGSVPTQPACYAPYFPVFVFGQQLDFRKIRVEFPKTVAHEDGHYARAAVTLFFKGGFVSDRFCLFCGCLSGWRKELGVILAWPGGRLSRF
jgi:hypothetical protein